jgi:hypothetical protein
MRRITVFAAVLTAIVAAQGGFAGRDDEGHPGNGHAYACGAGNGVHGAFKGGGPGEGGNGHAAAGDVVDAAGCEK